MVLSVSKAVWSCPVHPAEVSHSLVVRLTLTVLPPQNLRIGEMRCGEAVMFIGGVNPCGELRPAPAVCPSPCQQRMYAVESADPVGDVFHVGSLSQAVKPDRQGFSLPLLSS
jgi:hypothetical protein